MPVIHGGHQESHFTPKYPTANKMRLMRRMMIVTSLAWFTPCLRAQAPRDTGRVLSEVMNQVARLGSEHGESIFPGFRPDTIPVAFILPSHGTFLFGWRGPLPAGFGRVLELPGAAWGDVAVAGSVLQVAGRAVAQLTIGRTEPLVAPSLVASTFREAFDVFERATARPRRKFGAGEDPLLVSSYPVFDEENEAAFEMEGQVLAGALAAGTLESKRDLAARFIAIRRTRHRRLALDFAQLDQQTETNEGIATYALTRVLQYMVKEGPSEWRPDVDRQLAIIRGDLRELPDSRQRSIRHRYYSTGAAEAFLLDDLVGDTWKARVMRDDAALEILLGAASGMDAAGDGVYGAAAEQYNATPARQVARARIAALQASRQEMVDSILSASGVRVVLAAGSFAGRDFKNCGFDAQNFLPVTPVVQIQLRRWKPCAGEAMVGEFDVPSVHDATSGTMSAVVGVEGSVRFTTDGADLRINDGAQLPNVRNLKMTSARATIETAAADVTRQGNTITIRPRQPQE
jgi:hypothetical protein